MLDSHHPKCVAGQLTCSGHAEHTLDTPSPSRGPYEELATFASKERKGAGCRSQKTSQTHLAIAWGYQECAQRVRSMRLDGGGALDHPNRMRTCRMVPMSRNGHSGRSSWDHDNFSSSHAIWMIQGSSSINSRAPDTLSTLSICPDDRVMRLRRLRRTALVHLCSSCLRKSRALRTRHTID